MPPLKEGYIRITEGTATMDYDEKEAVFYNKVQVLIETLPFGSSNCSLRSGRRRSRLPT